MNLFNTIRTLYGKMFGQFPLTISNKFVGNVFGSYINYMQSSDFFS